MAVVTLTEYARLATDAGGTLLPLVDESSLVTTQTALTSFASSTQFAAAFNASTRFVVLTTDTKLHYLAGENPTATTSCTRLPADGMIVLKVGRRHKLAVIAAA